MRRFFVRYAGLFGLALMASACSQTLQPPPAPMASFGVPAEPRAFAPTPSLAPNNRPDAEPVSGYEIDGAGFYGDLHFLEADGAVRAIYAHAVDGDVTMHAELRPESPWLHDGVRRFEGFAENGDTLVVELEAGVCEMNGRSYGRFAHIETEAGVFQGCASEIGPQPSWSDDLPRYLPMIRTCLDQSQSSSMAFVRGAGRAQVLHVQDNGPDAVVRMRFGESGRWDCSLEGGQTRWRVVSDEAPVRPGESDPVFILNAMPEAGEACAIYERVVDQNGETLGALGYDACMTGPMAQLEPGLRF
ncbi:hypothetical protein ACFELO_03375 [Oceanicaulis sp. LC35]|uniref:hypothetical protein n=1 Tax=Oceanicaulis sp. LC35 TaxID=3349635 RepID=UPI003F87BF4A